MAVRGLLLWSALPALGAATAPAGAAPVVSDVTSLVQSHDLLGAAAKTKARGDRSNPGMMPQFVAPGGYWMLSQGRQDAHSAMDKSIVFMTNYSAAARAYPDFVIPAAGTAANATGSAKKALGELKGALAVLKRNLTGYQKSLATVLGNIAQQRDLPFQEKWKGAMHDVITSLQRHRNFLAGIGAASQFCPKTTEFIKDFQLTGENYTRLLGKAMAALPPPQPMGNGIGFNPLALEAKREMYNVSKIMMERLVGQVNRLIPEYLNATKACEWGPAPNATASSEAGAPVPPPVLQQPATTQPPQKPRSAKKKTPWPDVAPDSTADPQQDQAGQPAQQEAQPQQPPQPQQQPQQQPPQQQPAPQELPPQQLPQLDASSEQPTSQQPEQQQLPQPELAQPAPEQPSEQTPKLSESQEQRSSAPRRTWAVGVAAAVVVALPSLC
uniref:Uncharacterized protein n=1 Tax=Alexandrium monilatum TaxID=311494 RepID=A0A7S4QK57_9DINO